MQPPSSAAALQSVQAFKPRSNEEIMNTANDKYGVTDSNARLSSLRGLVGNLQSSVEAVDPSVTGRTTGSFVTEGQRQALVNKEQAPILGSLAKEQGVLGQEQATNQSSTALASQMASALLSEDKDTYQRLLDQYNASVASEKEAEAKRQYESTLAEQKRQFDTQQAAAAKAARSSGSISPSLSGASPSAAAAVAPNAVKAQAVSQVDAMLGRIGSRSFLEEVQAISKSASYGNPVDQAKVELLRVKQPGLFNPDGSLNNRRINGLWNEYTS